MYVKLFSSILTSSVWSEDLSTRVVWITMLALADRDGFVRGAPSGLARQANVPLGDCQKALKVLESPDLESQSQEWGGRRIEAMEGGWFILNYAKYRDITTRADRKMAVPEAWTETKGYVYYIESEDRVKIGFSVNPWARLSEIKTSIPSATLVAYEPGTMADERSRHSEFSADRIEREWFHKSSAINELIQSLNHATVVATDRSRSTTTVPSDADAVSDADVEEGPSDPCDASVALATTNGGGPRTFAALKDHLAVVLGEVQEGRISRLRADEMRTVQAELVFAYWQAETGHEKALLDDKRLNRLKKCLKENQGDVHELLYAVDGWRKDPTFRGLAEKENRVLDGIENIFTDRGRIERLAGHCKGRREGRPHKMAVRYLEVAKPNGGADA